MNRLHVAATIPVLLAAAAVAAQQSVVEGIVVRVNDRILTIADMRQRVLERTAELGHPLPPEAVPGLVREAADELVLLAKAEELKLEVAPEEIDAAVTQLRQQNNIGDDAAFEQLLRSLGIGIDQLRQRLGESILINRVLSKEMGDLPLTEAELRQRYERDKEQFRQPPEAHLEHIVFSVAADGSDLEAAQGKARRLVAAARSGQDFLKLAQDESDAGDASGGDLGTVAIPDLREEVRREVDKLEPGEISEPFETSAGVHVVKLVERIPPTIPPFEEVANQLRERELSERYRQRLSNVVDELKKRYIVEIHPELLAEAS